VDRGGDCGSSRWARLVVYFYTRSDMWLDEALSVNIARLPLSDLRGALKQDGAPPFYYLLLHVWTGGCSVPAMSRPDRCRVCGMAGAVVATGFTARRIAGTTAAWLAVVW